jgi:hypothetical protein
MPRYLFSLNEDRSSSTDFAVELPDDAAEDDPVGC